MSPQSLRWFYLSRELSKLGYKIDVLTIKMPERFKELLDSIPETIKIHRTYPGPFYSLTFKYSPPPSPSTSPTKSSSLWSTLSRIHYKIYKALNFIFIPDIFVEWLPFSLQKGLSLIKTNKYDLIISSSDPRVCHLAGYFLKKKSRIPWLADYGDPWLYPIPAIAETKFKRYILKKIENRILREMDAVIVTTEATKRLYLEQKPFLPEEKISVITQGYDMNMYKDVQPEVSSKFRIVYCGSFYKKLRDPSAFFEAVKEIDNKDVEVIIAGRINEFAGIIKQGGLHNKIQYLGFLSHRRCLELQKGAAVLLNFGYRTGPQLPGKIYEYFGAGRPVLCIRGSDSDLSSDLTLGYNKGLVVSNNKKDIKEGILKLYDLWKEKLLETHFNLEEVEDFTWHKHAERLSEIIERIC